jgi:hypothetical protein
MATIVLTVFIMGAIIGGFLTALAMTWLVYLHDKGGDQHSIMNFRGKHWKRLRRRK